MTSLDRNAAELRGLVNDFLRRFRADDGAAMDGPHAGLNCHELSIVERLGDDGPAMMRELAAHLNLAANTVTTVVDAMVDRGLVSRDRDADDRRVVRVALTDDGKKAYKAAVAEMLSVMKSMLRSLDASEQQAFMKLFRKIGAAAAATETRP